jgi:(1->4)-alpha-D-glucan 1-alpha-D-glucosylmutase
LQFNERFRLADALALVPYLCKLGISHVYASPLLKACPGSTHGYDVCDFGALNPELGTEADLARIVAELRRHGMGLVLDIVPNHMGIGGPENLWWWDVLTHGRDSRFARYFDISWEASDGTSEGKVVLPVLGDHYEQVLERGELRCEFQDGKFGLNYFERRFPLAPKSVLGVLKRADELCNQEIAREASSVASNPTKGGNKVLKSDGDGPRLHSSRKFARGLADSRVAASRAIVTALRELNHDRKALDDLVRQQHYRLVFWRCDDAELNYRRFFSIDTLAGVRVEDKKVFAATHALLKRWIDRGLVDGLRVDHIDGLADPKQYVERLRALAPRAWIVLEKILGPDELLPAGWPVAGTSGYDFSNLVDGLFVDSAGEESLTRFYSNFTGEPTDAKAVLRQGKRRVLRELFASDVRRLTEMLVKISAGYSRWIRLGRDALLAALTELIACFPVYRTYVRRGRRVIAEADFANIREAVSAASASRSELAEPFDFLNELLLSQLNGPLENDFVIRFQQLTGAVMAKGVEDTAFYSFNRLAALNEVGGDPGRFGIQPEVFHERCLFRQARQPDAMLSSSTHDTKRSEDVRARLCLLSEIPALWQRAVARWAAMNEQFRQHEWPDRNAEYLLYQILFGAWPISAERAMAYMEKAAREAKQHTTWSDKNRDYETALLQFISGAFANTEFTRDLDDFVTSLTDGGWINSLAGALLKLTAPGVPDIYQGTELWNLSLVDPDNRRPVDFNLRRRLLSELDSHTADEIWSFRGEGLPKLWLIRQTLKLRSARPELFTGLRDYEPLRAKGAKAAHVIAFIRSGASATIVPRLVLGMAGDWGDTSIEIPPGNWQNVFTNEEFPGGCLRLEELLRRFPVALLAR